MDELQQTKALWKQCFDDSDEFIDLYFKKRYTDERNMSIYQDDKLIAALQMIPYKMSFHKEVINASYISGAATSPDYRNRGIMASLLKKTHERMYQDNVAVSFLIPANKHLFEYYKKFGYSTIFRSWLKEVRYDDVQHYSSVEVRITDNLDERIYKYFSHRMNLKPCAILHDFDDLSIVMDDIKLAGGKIAVAYDNDDICGVAFAVNSDGCVIVKEILFNTPEAKDAIFTELMEYFENKVSIYRIFDNEELVPYGMAKIINLKPLLSIWAKSNKKEKKEIIVSGGDIPGNEGVYLICDGEVHYFKDDEEMCKSYIYKHHDDINLLEICYGLYDCMRNLIDDQRPYMNLMMD